MDFVHLIKKLIIIKCSQRKKIKNYKHLCVIYNPNNTNRHACKLLPYTSQVNYQSNSCLLHLKLPIQVFIMARKDAVVVVSMFILAVISCYGK